MSMRKRFHHILGATCLFVLTLAACSAGSAKPSHPSQFAYATSLGGKSVIHLMLADGSNNTALTDGTHNDGDPAWSPDGKQLAFLSDRDGRYEIYLMQADGSNQVRLTDSPENKTRLRWSPDGKQIAYQDASSGPVNVYAVYIDGSGTLRLADQIQGVQFLTWSPDSQWLAFSTYTTAGGDLYSVKRNGAGLKKLTGPASIIRTFLFSPDGAVLAFSSASLEKAIDDQVYRVKVDGSGLTQLTSPPGRSMPNFWFPDGKRIAFTSDQQGSPQLYRMNADGSQQARLENLGPGSLSPNGKRIAYLAEQDLAGQDGSQELFVAGINGSNPQQVTRLNQVISQFWWSPDGRYFSLSTNLNAKYDPNNWRTWIVSVDGSSQLDVTKDAGIGQVAWRP